MSNESEKQNLVRAFAQKVVEALQALEDAEQATYEHMVKSQQGSATIYVSGTVKGYRKAREEVARLAGLA